MQNEVFPGTPPNLGEIYQRDKKLPISWQTRHIEILETPDKKTIMHCYRVFRTPTGLIAEGMVGGNFTKMRRDRFKKKPVGTIRNPAFKEVKENK